MAMDLDDPRELMMLSGWVEKTEPQQLPQHQTNNYYKQTGATSSWTSGGGGDGLIHTLARAGWLATVASAVNHQPPEFCEKW